MEQLSFLPASLPSDLAMLRDSLNEMITKICLDQSIDTNFVSVEERRQKADDNTSKVIGYSVWILEPMNLNKSDRVFSIVPKNTVKTKRFEVEIRYDRQAWLPIPADFIEKITETKKKDGDDVYITKKYFLFSSLDSPNIYSFLYQTLQMALKGFKPSERFGCCEKYVECSNAKKCLHNNPFYSRCCWYRQNLEAGKIYYGVNKNI